MEITDIDRLERTHSFLLKEPASNWLFAKNTCLQLLDPMKDQRFSYEMRELLQELSEDKKVFIKIKKEVLSLLKHKITVYKNTILTNYEGFNNRYKYE